VNPTPSLASAAAFALLAWLSLAFMLYWQAPGSKRSVFAGARTMTRLALDRRLKNHHMTFASAPTYVLSCPPESCNVRPTS